MNRLDPRLQASSALRLLTRDDLDDWSAEAFELAQAIARAPVTVTGGFSNTQVTLGLATRVADKVVASIPVDIGAERITLNLDNRALDALAALLQRGAKAPNAGRTLSLDAVEAILAGLLAPLDDLSVEAGSWRSDSPSGGPCAFQFNTASIAIQGTAQALRTLHAAMMAKADRLVAAPLSYLKLPTRPRLAVTVERMLGSVSLNADELAALERGGGVVLDTVWPRGRVTAGRRFLSTDRGWRLEENLNDRAVIVRSGHAIRALDDPGLATPVDGTGSLELVQGDALLATGHLASVEREGMTLTVFVIDRLV